MIHQPTYHSLNTYNLTFSLVTTFNSTNHSTIPSSTHSPPPSPPIFALNFPTPLLPYSYYSYFLRTPYPPPHFSPCPLSSLLHILPHNLPLPLPLTSPSSSYYLPTTPIPHPIYHTLLPLLILLLHTTKQTLSPDYLATTPNSLTLSHSITFLNLQSSFHSRI